MGKGSGGALKGKWKNLDLELKGLFCGTFVYGIGWCDFDWWKVKIRGYRL
jgi:hypothetical protein